jgi:hypothetical protein
MILTVQNPGHEETGCGLSRRRQINRKESALRRFVWKLQKQGRCPETQFQGLTFQRQSILIPFPYQSDMLLLCLAVL